MKIPFLFGLIIGGLLTGLAMRTASILTVPEEPIPLDALPLESDDAQSTQGPKTGATDYSSSANPSHPPAKNNSFANTGLMSVQDPVLTATPEHANVRSTVL